MRLVDLKLPLRAIVIVWLIFRPNIFLGQSHEWGAWKKWGDQNNGTYLNPILPADFSDIDCIKVGDDYYAISSTFQFSPGMTLLHSKDLVNWEYCTNIIQDLTQISNRLNWNVMDCYGKGVWAGTLRYHKDRFYLFFGTPDDGYFMTSSRNPKGPWQPLTPLLEEAGWDDCTAFWDEDGTACFVGTHFSDGYKTYLFDMSPDGKHIDKSSARLINEGNGREANKIIKKDQWYYLVFSEYKRGLGRYVMARRSRCLKGPYLEERQLALPSTEAMEPNQGGIVEGPNGQWYFLTHHGTGDWSGRVVSLLPVTWLNGWPIIGKVLFQDIGSMLWTSSIPLSSDVKLSFSRSDDFNNDTLAPQWQWNYQPRKEYYSLTERKGWLRLKAFRPLENNHLLKAGNTLTQRCFRTQDNVVTIKMDVTGMRNGQQCGLCHFSQTHSSIGVLQTNWSRHIIYRTNDSLVVGPKITCRYVWFRSCWGLDGLSHYSYSIDGEHFHPIGNAYQMSWGNYRGDRIGIFCFNDKEEMGYVDIDYFHYQF
jgi:beta-xylosidase